MQRHVPHALFRRQLSGRLGHAHPFLADFTDQADCSGTINVNPNGLVSPPFAGSYSKVYNNSHLLAVADEEGYISILDTTQRLPQGLCVHEAYDGVVPKAQWLAHNNAVFDVAWAKDDTCMLTASGDQSVALWDTGTALLLGTFPGHGGSVKSVSPSTTRPDMFASGGRDGAVCVWDYRQPPTAALQPNGMRSFAPVLHIKGAHGKLPSSRKRHRGSHRHLPSTACNSVTAIQFLQQDMALASGSASDGVVKYWDLRYASGPSAALQPCTSHATAEELARIPSHSWGMRPHGITSLALDPAGHRLLVSCTDHVHYLYSPMHPSSPPLATFTGHTAGSFYVKAAFSGDGSHILSGSSDKRAYIWQVDAPSRAPYVLEGHEGEVTGVAWCPTDMCEIATCGDDAVLKVWRVQRPWPSRPMVRPEARVRQVTQDTAELSASAVERPALGNMASTPAAAPAVAGALELVTGSGGGATAASVPTTSARAFNDASSSGNMEGSEPGAALLLPLRTPLTPQALVPPVQPTGNTMDRPPGAQSASAVLQRSMLEFMTPPAAKQKKYMQTSIAKYLGVAAAVGNIVRRQQAGLGATPAMPLLEPSGNNAAIVDKENMGA